MSRSRRGPLAHKRMLLQLHPVRKSGCKGGAVLPANRLRVILSLALTVPSSVVASANASMPWTLGRVVPLRA